MKNDSPVRSGARSKRRPVECQAEAGRPNHGTDSREPRRLTAVSNREVGTSRGLIPVSLFKATLRRDPFSPAPYYSSERTKIYAPLREPPLTKYRGSDPECSHRPGSV